VSDRVHRGTGRESPGRPTLDIGQAGGFLLEALIATLIFAFGALAIANLHARAARHVNDAQFRAEAIQLVEATLGQMRAADAATLYANFDSRAGGAGYRALLEKAKQLPGVDDSSNAPEVNVSDGPSMTSRRVDITVFWRLPGDASVHRHGASAVAMGR
jgi:type IV pilus assembly protein PilV